MAEENQNQSSTQQNDKEFNFRKLEEKYERQLAQERNARLEMEKEIQRLSQEQKQTIQQEDDDSEPYVDQKRLKKTLSAFEKNLEEKIDRKAEEKARILLEEKDKNVWLEENNDFYDVMQHAEKLALRSPQLAKSILNMPDGFERQKLVYSNIKAMNLHQPEPKQSSVQEKIDSNRKSPYYASPVSGTPPYAQVGDFSVSGQKNAYEKMKELQKRLTG